MMETVVICLMNMPWMVFFPKIQCFSFGIMMLEIISGKKNSGFYQLNRSSNLAGYVSDYDKALFMLLFCL